MPCRSIPPVRVNPARRPEAIPDLPGLLLAPGVEDGVQLYDVACAGCHGYRGEGLFAIGLADTGLSQAAARAFIVRGIPDLGMPAFAGNGCLWTRGCGAPGGVIGIRTEIRNVQDR